MRITDRVFLISQIFPGMQAKLSDFGLARSKTHTSVTWAAHEGVGGTFPYTAPEVLVGVPDKGKMLSQPSSDIWSMCCTLIEWYTGEHPWTYQATTDKPKKQVKNKQKAGQQPDQLTKVSSDVRSVLAVGLTYLYEERPSASQMKEAFSMFCIFVFPIQYCSIQFRYFSKCLFRNYDKIHNIKGVNKSH